MVGEADRWGRGRYLFVWALLTAAQGATLVSIGRMAQADAPTGALVVYGLGVLLLQGMKLVPTFGRLRDLGRAPDDALWAFVPLMNLALWSWLIGRRPSEARYAARRAAWEGRVLAPEAWWEGLRALLTVPGPVAAAVAVLAAGSALGHVVAEGLLGLDPAARASMRDVVDLALLGCGLGIAVVARRPGLRTLTGGVPVALAVLALMLRVALTLDLGPGADMRTGPVVTSFLIVGVMVPIEAVAWGVAAWIVLRATDPRPDGAPVSRFVALAVVRLTAVVLGLRVILPGVWFAVSYALSDVLLARGEDRGAPLDASTERVAPARGIVLKVLLLYGMASTVASGVSLALAGVEVWSSAQLGVGVLPWSVAAAQGVADGLVGVACLLALRAVAVDLAPRAAA